MPAARCTGTEASNFEAQTSVDLEALEQALSVVKTKNVDYIQQIQAQEVKAQQCAPGQPFPVQNT